MAFSLQGIAVSKGIAIGRAHMLASAALEVQHYLIDAEQVESEIARLSNANSMVQQELEALRHDLPVDAPSEMGAFLDVHLMILNDAMLALAPLELISRRRYNAEWALVTQLEVLVRQFDEIEDEYLRARKADIEQVVDRVLKVLAGMPGLASLANNQRMASSLAPDLIVVAHDIAPSDMLQFKKQTFAGFITDLGGKTSHTAIVARSLDIPATVGLQQASQLIRQDDLLIIDGDAGIVIINPSPMILEEYQYRQSERTLERRKLNRLKNTPALTLCGKKIELLANIEMPSDADDALANGADGIGLFRSEFLFMNRAGNLPDEEEQFAAYSQVIASMQGRPVTIRTIDIGADKPMGKTLDKHVNDYEAAPNPALGLRAIRYSLAEPKMFQTQLRAILRASAFGEVRLLIPMLAHAHEINLTLEAMELAKKSLRKQNKKFNEAIKIGAMIEIPAAVFALPLFLEKLDFLSIGTNDLIQYTLAIDRTDNTVAHLYDPIHPAILHLIHQTILQAGLAGVPVSVCGEMAGDTTLTRLLLGMGLTCFSMHPSQLLDVKQEILRTELSKTEKMIKEVLTAYDPAELRRLVEQINRP